MLVLSGDGLDVASRALEIDGLIGLALGGGPAGGGGEAQDDDREMAGSHQSPHVISPWSKGPCSTAAVPDAASTTNPSVAEVCSKCVGLDEAGRWWLDRVGDQAGRNGESPARLDPASRSHGDDRRAGWLHGREYLERIAMDGLGAGGVAGVGPKGRVPAIRAGHRMRARRVPLEQTEHGAPHGRLGQQKRGQGREGEGAAGAQGPKHQGDKVTEGRTQGQPATPR